MAYESGNTPGPAPVTVGGPRFSSGGGPELASDELDSPWFPHTCGAYGEVEEKKELREELGVVGNGIGVEGRLTASSARALAVSFPERVLWEPVQQVPPPVETEGGRGRIPSPPGQGGAIYLGHASR